MQHTYNLQVSATGRCEVRQDNVFMVLSASGGCMALIMMCALRQWKKGVFKPGGSVATTHRLLDTRVGAHSFLYQALLVQGGCMLGFSLHAGHSIVRATWK